MDWPRSPAGSRVMVNPTDKDKNKRTGSASRPGGGKPVTGKTDPRIRKLDQFVVEEIELATDVVTGPQRQRRGPPRWWSALKLWSGVAGLALVAIAAGLVGRGPWPGDETRFLAIAWEMWAQGNLLVPKFNGTPVAVAPLYAWSVHLAWLAFGESGWAARLVPGLYLIGSLFFVSRIAGLLWPGQTEVRRYMPFVLLGGIYWVWSSSWFTPDFLTVFFTLFALHAVLWMWRTRDLRVWMLLGAALGLGLLASGSLVLLYVLPIALLAPLWTRGTPTMPWSYWYVDIAKATLVAVAIFALWAVPFSGRAGFATLLPMLTAPAASHALDLFPSARPWWWYLFLLPFLGFPWSLWPLPWLRIWDVRREPVGNGLAFCMLWALVTIVILSPFAVRQPQLLLPLVPSFFLVVGWVLLNDEYSRHDPNRLASTMIFPLMLIGAALAVVPKLPRVEYLPDVLWELSPWVGVAIIGLGVAVGWLPIPELRTRIINMAATVVAVLALAMLLVGWQLNPRLEMGGAAAVAARAQRAGQPVAYVGRYQGELHFAGRLRQPLVVLTPDDAPAWVAANPGALLVTYTNGWQPPVAAGAQPVHEQPYKDTTLRIWSLTEVPAGPP